MNSPESVASTGAATGATAGATGVDPAVGPERVPAGVTPVITDLYFYPVKSCRGVRMTEAALWETGLLLDRFWMVIDENDSFVTQRNLPRMALIETAIRFEQLRLKAPGMLQLDIPVGGFDYDPARRITVRVWNDEVPAFVEDELVNAWFSRFLERDLRVVRIDPDHRRICDPQWTGWDQSITQFADGFPLLVISKASLEDLNRRLGEKGEAPMLMDRFRPNVVIDGVDAYSEDHLVTLATSDYGLRLVKPCTRCRITPTNQQTAEVGNEPLDLLATYRHDTRVDGLAFGINAIVERGADEATLKVGDRLEATIAFG